MAVKQPFAVRKIPCNSTVSLALSGTMACSQNASPRLQAKLVGTEEAGKRPGHEAGLEGERRSSLTAFLFMVWKQSLVPPSAAALVVQSATLNLTGNEFSRWPKCRYREASCSAAPSEACRSSRIHHGRAERSRPRSRLARSRVAGAAAKGLVPCRGRRSGPGRMPEGGVPRFLPPHG